MAVASCNSDESLDQLAMNFTTSYAHFGSLQTVELVKGGNRRNVTLKNRDQFVEKLLPVAPHWYNATLPARHTVLQ